MNTDELIRALVADSAVKEPPIARTLAKALLAGVAGAAVVFALILPIRPDFAYSIVHSPRFQFKFVLTITLALAAFALTRRFLRPEGQAGALAWLLGLPALMLAGAAALEMYLLPANHWAVYARGQNSLPCLLMIPLISIAPLAAILYALRQGAPSRPGLAGAAAGLLASGIAATLYASHCVDDSPLFIAIWYTIGIAIVTGAGAFLGRRLLKW